MSTRYTNLELFFVVDPKTHDIFPRVTASRYTEAGKVFMFDVDGTPDNLTESAVRSLFNMAEALVLRGTSLWNTVDSEWSLNTRKIVEESA